MPKHRDPSVVREDDAPLRVADPRGIRAWAHPARLAILDALSTGDELTATECADVTGLSASATAYHLKLLERYGLIEPATPRPDGRERPWRMTERRVTVDLDTSTPAAASATSAVTGAYIDSTRAVGMEFMAGGHNRARGVAGCRRHEHGRSVVDRGGRPASGPRTRGGARPVSGAGVARRAAGGKPARPGDERRRPAPTEQT